MCDTGVLVPVLRAGLERWFDVAVVADTSATMAVWDDTVAALADLLERHGAFRGVTRWALAERDGEIEVLSPSGLRTDRRVADLAGRRLVLVVTDAVDALWAAPPSGKHFGRGGSTGRSRWSSCCRRGRGRRPGSAKPMLRSRRPGQDSRTTSSKWSRRGGGFEDEPPDYAVPVVALDEASLSPWRRMVMGAPGVSVPGVLPAPEDGVDGGASGQAGLPGEVDLDRLGNVLRSTVSAQAYRLADCCPRSR